MKRRYQNSHLPSLTKDEAVERGCTCEWSWITKKGWIRRADYPDCPLYWTDAPTSAYRLGYTQGWSDARADRPYKP